MVFGAIPSESLPIREQEATFLCDLNAGLSTGLYLDLREVRFAARDHAQGIEVLNLFAHTCAFSVHAALAGAKRVTSVDVSKKALRRGRENMVASGCSPDDHRWFTDDVLKHVGRGSAGQYGLVIVDPPVFGRAKGVTFSLMKDLPELLAGCLRSLADEGVLIFATHARALTEDHLLRALRASSSRDFEVLKRLGLPWDHPVQNGDITSEDRGDYLKTLVIRVASK